MSEPRVWVRPDGTLVVRDPHGRYGADVAWLSADAPAPEGAVPLVAAPEGGGDDGVRVQATEYVVSALPEDNGERGWHYGSAFDITVAYRGSDRWAVIRHSRCLSISGGWSHESIPSGRTDEWLAEHRFDLDTALRLAREQAPHTGVNGHTVADVKARIEEAHDA